MIRARDAALFLAVALALLSLPVERLSPAWLAAGSLPALLAGLLRARRCSVLVRRILAVVLQVAAVGLAVWWAGTPATGHVLTGLLLPPLVYLPLRRRGHDAAWAALASFGVLFAGLELGSALSVPLLATWLAAVTTVLLLDSRARASSLRPYRAILGTEPPPVVVRRSVLVLGACLVVALALRDALLPLSLRVASLAAGERGEVERRLGLPEHFDLGGAAGARVLLASDRILRMRSLGGETPADLYLRYAHFDVAGLDRWRMAPVQPVLRDVVAGGWQWRRPVADVEVETIEIEPLEGRSPFVFLVPGSFKLDGLSTVVGDPFAGWLRVGEAEQQAAYRVHFQSLRDLAEQAAIDPDHGALAELPPELDRPELRRVGGELLAGAPRAPARLASFLERRLAERYRYALTEPRGPYRQALLDFLLGDGHGYCMHFASAMAVLLRQRGVPCRIAVGLFGGEPEIGDEPEARLFGAADAHAWVELPFVGLGWVAFDPTPPASRGIGAAILEAGGVPGQTEAEVGSAGDEAATLGAPASSSPLGPVWTWPLLLLLWLATLRRRHVRSPVGDLDAPAAARPARRILMRILRALRRAGYPRPTRATLERYLELLSRVPQPERAAIGGAFQAYQEVRFGGRRLDAERQARLAAGLAAARRC